MKSTRPIVLALAASLLGGMVQIASAQGPSAAVSPPIEVSVDCTSSPEVVRVKNERSRPIVVRSVGSTYRPRAGEPYRLGKAVKPGKSVTYTFGTGKGRGKRLSRSFIFDNDESTEAVIVRTNRGRVRVRCTDGTNRPPEPAGAPDTEDAPTAVTGEPADAIELLAGLTVVPEVGEGYERSLFRHWVDADGDGCDTRQEVLIAESLTPVELGAGCSVEGGTWLSELDGDTITNPASIDINHTVPLKEAWRSGAHAWSPERREAFANDLLDERTLRAGSAGANRDQGDADPAVWLPADRDVACAFVSDWVAIKATWGLSVDEAEREALETTLSACAPASVSGPTGSG